MIFFDKAVTGIHGTRDKTLAIVLDSKYFPFLVTIAAYEADE